MRGLPVRRLITLSFAAVLLCAVPARLLTPAVHVAQTSSQELGGWASATFAVIADTQRTLFIEKYVLGREDNEIERQAIVRALSREEVGGIVHVGDLVSNGGSSDEWRYFDALFQPARGRGIPVLPVIGNHEYWGGGRGFDFLFARFPDLERARWYARRVGPLALVAVDSNRLMYGAMDWERQTSWFRATLRALDENAEVRAILVFSHHPPFTNSTVTPPDENVRDDFLPAFFASVKTVAFVSGHAHGYERFSVLEKSFIVSGGGGGPRVKLLEGARARYPDLYFGPSPRPFNYLLIQTDFDRLRIETMGLDKGEDTVRVIDFTEIPYP